MWPGPSKMRGHQHWGNEKSEPRITSIYVIYFFVVVHLFHEFKRVFILGNTLNQENDFNPSCAHNGTLSHLHLEISKL